MVRRPTSPPAGDSNTTSSGRGARRDSHDRVIVLLLIEPPTGAASELPLAREPLGNRRLPGSRKRFDEDDLVVLVPMIVSVFGMVASSARRRQMGPA
jgi:hypothetical protein